MKTTPKLEIRGRNSRESKHCCKLVHRFRSDKSHASRFKGMSVDDFLGGGFMGGEDETAVRQNVRNG